MTKPIAEMFMPVRCTHCGGVYDCGSVEVVARYVDCSVWKAPCCGLTVDDRKPPWKHRSDIEEIDKSAPAAVRPGRFPWEMP